MACDQGSSNNLLIAGHRPTGPASATCSTSTRRAAGARTRDRDGLSAVFSIAGNTWNVPVEVVERRFPVRVERYELREDSGGPGAHRGGPRHPPRPPHARPRGGGVDRGQPREGAAVGPRGRRRGRGGGYQLSRGRRADSRGAEFGSKVAGVPLRAGDVVAQFTAGGGGWGEPRARERESVARDVRLGYVSVGGGVARLRDE